MVSLHSERTPFWWVCTVHVHVCICLCVCAHVCPCRVFFLCVYMCDTCSCVFLYSALAYVCECMCPCMYACVYVPVCSTIMFSCVCKCVLCLSMCICVNAHVFLSNYNRNLNGFAINNTSACMFVIFPNKVTLTSAGHWDIIQPQDSALLEPSTALGTQQDSSPHEWPPKQA